MTLRFLLLMLWSLSGVAVAAATSPAAAGRLAWAPPAMVLGPMWAAVARDQRMGPDAG